VSVRPSVDVGVVTWNTAELTSSALRHLLATDQGCDLRLLVQDNASSDGTAETLGREVPEAEVEVSSANWGFAKAVNRLLDRSTAPWFLALNSDAWPEQGAVGRLVAAAEASPAAAAVAPLLLRPDGSQEHSTHPFPSLAVAALDAVGGRRWLPTRVLDRLCLEGAWKQDRARTVDWAVGAALLIRRSALAEIGGLDERFFMYVEDLEWCWRAHSRGWSIRFEPAAVVRHVGNASGRVRFGERRLAAEATNLETFLRTARGAAFFRAYRALRTVGLTRRYLAARRAHTDDQGYWRLLLKLELGLEAPLALSPPQEEASRRAPTEGSPQARVAVVVSTRDRCARLPRLVAALERQTLTPSCFEVVIVDDGSRDDTPAVLERLSRESPLRITALRTEGVGPAAGRNLGWRRTDCPVVAFPDDDCVPDPGWLEAGLAAFADGGVVVIGRTRPPADQQRLSGQPFSLVLDTSSAQFFESCNAFYARADLLRVGGFDERFRRPSGEDTDLGLRVLTTGVEPLFAPEAIVDHDVRSRSALQAAREATRWEDLPLVIKGRPWARRRLAHRWLFWKPSHPAALLALGGLAVAVRWRPGAVLALPWLRYRLTVEPVGTTSWARASNLPGALLVDGAEVLTMARGSLRHRTLLL
jgi:N-acetylglucosaminyl-diphospho-decaprenol L-rhamnosyltransferase